MDRQTALFRWLLGMTAESLPELRLRDLLDDLPVHVPPKVRRGSRAKVAAFLLRSAHRPEALAALEAALEDSWQLALHILQREPARFAELARRVPDFAVAAEWAAERAGRRELYAAALEALDAPTRAAVEQRLGAAVAWAEREQRLAQDIARARAEAAAGVDQLQRQEAAAKRVAVDALTRERRVAAEAGGRLATAARRIRDLEARVAELEGLLGERDEQVARIVAAYEEQLGTARARGVVPAPRAPLAGLRVLVIGDPNRAAGYRAEAVAMGAAGVEFMDGMAKPGPRLAACVGAADLVVFNLAWAKHSAQETVEAHLSPGSRLARMRQAGLRAFREAVLATGPGREAGAGRARRA